MVEKVHTLVDSSSNPGHFIRYLLDRSLEAGMVRTEEPRSLSGTQGFLDLGHLGISFTRCELSGRPEFA